MKDCNCDAGYVSICRRFPCPRRTMDPVIDGQATHAPAPPLLAVLKIRLERARSTYRFWKNERRLRALGG